MSPCFISHSWDCHTKRVTYVGETTSWVDASLRTHLLRVRSQERELVIILEHLNRYVYICHVLCVCYARNASLKIGNLCFALRVELNRVTRSMSMGGSVEYCCSLKFHLKKSFMVCLGQRNPFIQNNLIHIPDLNAAGKFIEINIYWQAVRKL